MVSNSERLSRELTVPENLGPTTWLKTEYIKRFVQAERSSYFLFFLTDISLVMFSFEFEQLFGFLELLVTLEHGNAVFCRMV